MKPHKASPPSTAPTDDSLNESALRVATILRNAFGDHVDSQWSAKVAASLGDLTESLATLMNQASTDRDAGNDRGFRLLTCVKLSIDDNDVNWLKCLARYHNLIPETLSYTDARWTHERLYDIREDICSAEYADRLRAHFYAASVYEAPRDDFFGLLDYSDNDALFDLVSRRPRDVEVIMKIANESKIPLITDEIIAEYQKLHPALGHGML